MDLIVDHSIQVDAWGTAEALTENVAREYERNGERYALLKWAQESFDNFQVVPAELGHLPPGEPGVHRPGHHDRKGARPDRWPTPTPSWGWTPTPP